MILFVSGRCDIPAFYSEWFFNRMNEGFVDVRNPYNEHQVSRIILDEGGAENLLGKGDMLLMEPSTMGFQRIQGAFLSDDEVYSIVGFAAKHGTPDYLSEDIFEEPEVHEDEGDDAPVSDEDSDEVLYERAKQIVFERKCASASYLQRRMKIGYNRAARMIEMMEENGIIGPPNGSKPREILKYE